MYWPKSNRTYGWNTSESVRGENSIIEKEFNLILTAISKTYSCGQYIYRFFQLYYPLFVAHRYPRPPQIYLHFSLLTASRSYNLLYFLDPQWRLFQDWLPKIVPFFHLMLFPGQTMDYLLKDCTPISVRFIFLLFFVFIYVFLWKGLVCLGFHIEVMCFFFFFRF